MRHNIPLVSYIVLRGRCSQCNGTISISYPIVELATAVLALAVYTIYGASPAGIASFIFLALLLVISVIDLNLTTIPDALTFPGMLLTVVGSSLLPSRTILRALSGLLSGGLCLWVVAWVYERITGRQGMGGGDIKLLAMIGGALGWTGVPVVLFLASFTGSLYGLFLMMRHGAGMKHAVPFGPFLSIGATVVLFLNRPELAWVLRMPAQFWPTW